MSFTGAINSDMQKVITSLCRQWEGKDIYVPCSGNFTIEHILSLNCRCRSIHSNDVSLYSTAVGRYLTVNNVVVTLSDKPEYEWLKDWITLGLDTINTLLLCTKVLTCIGRKEPYFVRMLEAYKRHLGELHAQTKEKIKPILNEIKINSFLISCDENIQEWENYLVEQLQSSVRKKPSLCMLKIKQKHF